VLVEIICKLTLERAANLLAIATQLLQLAVDLLRKHRLGHVGFGALDCTADPAECPSRAPGYEKRGARGQAGGLCRLAADLGRDIDRRPTGSLEPRDLVFELAASG
jgi:hypothetical protein